MQPAQMRCAGDISTPTTTSRRVTDLYAKLQIATRRLLLRHPQTIHRVAGELLIRRRLDRTAFLRAFLTGRSPKQAASGGPSGACARSARTMPATP